MDMANLVYAATYRLSIRAPRVEQQLTSLRVRALERERRRLRVEFECERSSARVRALECSSARAPFIEFHTFKLASTIARTRRSSISST